MYSENKHKMLGLISFAIVIISGFFHIEFNGKIFLFDIFIPLAIIYIIYTKKNAEIDKNILCLVLICIINQIIQDSINATSINNFLKGTWKYMMIFPTLIFVYKFIYLIKINKFDLNTLFISTFGIGIILVYILQPNIHAVDGDWWKFGIALPITLFVIMFSIKINSYVIITSFLLLAICYINFHLGYRSLGFIVLIVTVYSLLVNTRVICKLNRFAILLIASIISIFLYFNLMHGLLSTKEKNKYETQVLMNNNYKTIELYTAGKITNIFKNGRAEIFSSSQRIIDEMPWSIIKGKGTWAMENNELIKSHSHILGAFIEYGLIGAFLWIYILLISLYYTYTLLQRYNKNEFIIITIFGLLSWDIIFSPFAGDHRFTTLIYFAFLKSNFKTGLVK